MMRFYLEDVFYNKLPIFDRIKINTTEMNKDFVSFKTKYGLRTSLKLKIEK
jgi:hypothetical protein